MRMRRALASVAILVSVVLSGCGAADPPTPVAAERDTTPAIAIDGVLASTSIDLTPEQVQYLAAVVEHERAVRDFLASVAATRAAVPREMVAVRWCEAGRWKSLPFGEATYYELDESHASTASGAYQYLDSTWRALLAKYFPHLAGVWPRAGLAPDFIQDAVSTAAFHDPAEGIGHWNASRSCWASRV